MATNKTEEILELMIHSIKGKKHCEEDRKKFVISRAFKLYKFQDPISSKNMAANFINCYSSLLKTTNNRCRSKYENILNCLKSNKSNSSLFPENCVEEMEIFIDC